jgi:hypothetical protein
MDPITFGGILGALAGLGASKAAKPIEKGIREGKKVVREYRDLRESSVDVADFFGQLFHLSESQARRCADNQHEAPPGEDTNQGGTFVCIHCEKKFSVKSW